MKDLIVAEVLRSDSNTRHNLTSAPCRGTALSLSLSLVLAANRDTHYLTLLLQQYFSRLKTLLVADALTVPTQVATLTLSLPSPALYLCHPLVVCTDPVSQPISLSGMPSPYARAAGRKDR